MAENKCVLIVGGSRGIGREIVRTFSREGWNVAFTYKNSEDEALLLAKECDALAIRADSAVPADISNAVETTVKRFGDIYCLVNNAAVSSFSLLTDVSSDEWRKIMAVDLDAPFLYSKAVLPYMNSQKKGRIINISSMWGLVGSSCEVAYSTAKAGLIGFTKALAKEVGPSGITVNAVAPGVIDTDMNSHLSPSDLDALTDETPLCRIGKPEEVAEAVLFLASDKADFITGAVLNVSGGFVT